MHMHSMAFHGSKELLPDEGIEDAPEQHNPQVALHYNLSVVCFSLLMQSSEIVTYPDPRSCIACDQISTINNHIRVHKSMRNEDEIERI